MQIIEFIFLKCLPWEFGSPFLGLRFVPISILCSFANPTVFLFMLLDLAFGNSGLYDDQDDQFEEYGLGQHVL